MSALPLLHAVRVPDEVISFHFLKFGLISRQISEKSAQTRSNQRRKRKNEENSEKISKKEGYLSNGPPSITATAYGYRLKGLHQRCTKEMDAYAGCMYYHTNEFDLCRKEQQAFESACPWSE